jgi:hypothetical protein
MSGNRRHSRTCKRSAHSGPGAYGLPGRPAAGAARHGRGARLRKPPSFSALAGGRIRRQAGSGVRAFGASRPELAPFPRFSKPRQVPVLTARPAFMASWQARRSGLPVKARLCRSAKTGVSGEQGGPGRQGMSGMTAALQARASGIPSAAFFPEAGPGKSPCPRLEGKPRNAGPARRRPGGRALRRRKSMSRCGKPEKAPCSLRGRPRSAESLPLGKAGPPQGCGRAGP